jgi:hypothetical protein
MTIHVFVEAFKNLIKHRKIIKFNDDKNDERYFIINNQVNTSETLEIFENFTDASTNPDYKVVLQAYGMTVI